MFNLESVGTLWRVPQSFAVLCPALLPPAVLQLVHHLNMVTVKVSASPEQIMARMVMVKVMVTRINRVEQFIDPLLFWLFSL